MALLLYINGQLADLDAGTVIAQTKQVNDLNSLDNRQANYTNKFRLPKTANNTRIMQFLTLPGNTSAVPYQKNECSLYSHTGECFVYKGWAVITDGGDSYDAAVYDGIIDLYKNIENKTLTDLGLEALVHTKSVQGVRNSWAINSPYRYILADYNGNNGLTNQNDSDGYAQVNIDYLVPSISVAWLWKKIFERYNGNVQPRGSVFDMPDFKQLYMTFPKGQVRTDVSDIALFKSSNYNFIDTRNDWRQRKIYYCKFMTTELYESQQLTHDRSIHLRVLTSGSYKIKIKGTLFGRRDGNQNIQKDSFIKIGKNCNNLAADQTGNNIINVFNPEPYFIHGQEHEQTSNPFQLNAFDSICAILGGQGSDPFVISPNGPDEQLTIELLKVDPESVDFSEALTDFSVKDFMNEVVHRFGLTLFKDKYSNVYTFLTLQEQLQSIDTENWTQKFSKKISENYVYGSYAQNNWFKYAYNDKESTHNDGAIKIENINLPDSRDAIKSKIYSPERIPVLYLGQNSNVYKLWEKEAVENPEPGEPAITYKPLDKRYYFLKAQQTSQFINLVSPVLGDLQNYILLHYREAYTGLSFKDIVTKYYSALQSILANAQIISAEIWLTDVDIANFDFKKLVYIEQLSSYFIVNKINNYIPGKVTKCELVRVQYTPIIPASAEPSLNVNTVYSVTTNTRPGTKSYLLSFTLNNFTVAENGEESNLYIDYSADGTTWLTAPQIAHTSPRAFTVPVTTPPAAAYLYFRMRYPALNLVSNIYLFPHNS